MIEKIDAINLWEPEERARELLPKMAYDYYASGANDEITLRENRAAYERIALLPRMLVDVSVRDLSTTVLGEPVELKPFNFPVQTINPGGYLTGSNETMAESAFHWQDDSRNFIRRAEIQKLFDASLRSKEAQLDSNEMNNAIVSIIPADTGKFFATSYQKQSRSS